jgi:hypothetical protein
MRNADVMNNKKLIAPQVILPLSIIFIIISISLAYPEFQNSLPKQTNGMHNGILLLFIYALVYGGTAILATVYFVLFWMGSYLISSA